MSYNRNPEYMKLCRTYGAMECAEVFDDRVAPYPKLCHPYRVMKGKPNPEKIRD